MATSPETGRQRPAVPLARAGRVRACPDLAAPPVAVPVPCAVATVRGDLSGNRPPDRPDGLPWQPRRTVYRAPAHAVTISPPSSERRTGDRPKRRTGRTRQPCAGRSTVLRGLCPHRNARPDLAGQATGRTVYRANGAPDRPERPAVLFARAGRVRGCPDLPAPPVAVPVPCGRTVRPLMP